MPEPAERSFPYATPRAFESALTAQFKMLAADSPHSHSQLRRQFAYDRLLARCFAAADAHRWVLKGGISMLARLRQARHSADVDLVTLAEDLPTALEGMRAAAGVDLGDFFLFDLGEPSHLVQGVEGVRVPVTARLGRRPYETFHVDLVTAVQITGVPETASPIVAVDIPGLVRPDYRIYPLADSVADKVCAILERHQGRPSTRFRDLVDLVLVARNRELNAAQLRTALISEHRRRASGSGPTRCARPGAVGGRIRQGRVQSSGPGRFSNSGTRRHPREGVRRSRAHRGTIDGHMGSHRDRLDRLTVGGGHARNGLGRRGVGGPGSGGSCGVVKGRVAVGSWPGVGV